MMISIGVCLVKTNANLLRMEKMLTNEEQIRELIDHLIDVAEDKPRWPSTTYAEGVQAALEWVIGDTDDHPLDLQSKPFEDEKDAN
jgi:hypothetical protein